jgi:hypothetical protein
MFEPCRFDFNRRRSAALRLALAGLLCGTIRIAGAGAQELPGIGTATADSLPRVAATPRRFSLLGDLRLRGDFVTGLPGGRENLERARSFLRLGAAMTPHPSLELGAALEAAWGSDANRDNPSNNDNESSDDVNLDLAYVRWQPEARSTFWGGRHALPLQLTPVVWDEDLRPVGAAARLRIPWRDFDTWTFAGGWFEIQNLDADDWSQLAAVQAGYSWLDGGPRGADVRAAFLHWASFDELVANKLARTNVVQAGHFRSDFDLADLQIDWRTQLGGVACQVDGEWVENLGADTESSAWRAGLSIGDLWRPWHVQLRYAFHRVESDAVLAAFNSDDWWFHSRMRGHRAGVVVAAEHGVTLGVSGSVERRDDLSYWTKRLLLDLHWDFSP